jgi:hexokinase
MDENTRQKLDALLRDHGMTEDILNLPAMTHAFLSQMRIALYGGASSIPILPTFLKPFGPLTGDRPVAVAELDDREVRVCLVTFSEGKPVISERNSFPIPGREYPAPLDDLLYAAAELLEPLLPQARAVAVCLPFPVDYDSKGDGSIRRFPGTMTVTDYEKKPVLADLKAELSSRGLPDLPMVLVSQPDAVLAAAGAEKPGQDRYLGLVWDSNIDAGFVAPGSIVLRWLAIPGHLMLFDGGFDTARCVPFSLVDLPKDRDSYAPGEDLYLKMVSTEYLGDTFRLMMIKAAERKLLTFGCSRDVLSLTNLDLESLIAFLEDPVKGGTMAHFCREPEDREIGIAVAEAVLDRAARLVCANLSAVLQFIHGGKDPDKPVCIGLWGDAFRHEPVRKALERHLNGFTRDVLGHHTTLCLGADMPAVGSAAVALYNV